MDGGFLTCWSFTSEIRLYNSGWEALMRCSDVRLTGGHEDAKFNHILDFYVRTKGRERQG